MSMLAHDTDSMRKTDLGRKLIDLGYDDLSLVVPSLRGTHFTVCCYCFSPYKLIAENSRSGYLVAIRITISKESYVFVVNAGETSRL